MTADSSVSEQLRALTSLQNLSLKLSATLTLDETLDAIVEAAMVICRADRAAISYINESGELRLLKHRGLSEEYVRERQLTRLDPTRTGHYVGKFECAACGATIRDRVTLASPRHPPETSMALN